MELSSEPYGASSSLASSGSVSSLLAIKQALDRLHVAPFCFTESDFAAEGEAYCWPHLEAKRVAPFTGHRLDMIPSYTSKKIPAPANHSKVYIVDDSAYYVGSDNMYPNGLVEFGYMIEGKSVEDLLVNYWDRVWQYSHPHCLTCGGTRCGPASDTAEDEDSFGL